MLMFSWYKMIFNVQKISLVKFDQEYVLKENVSYVLWTTPYFIDSASLFIHLQVPEHFQQHIAEFQNNAWH